MSTQRRTEDDVSTRPRMEAALLVLLLGLWVITWLPRLQGPTDLRWDAAVYYVLGTALAEGKGLRLLNEPGEIRGIQYPPGLPAIVALHQRVLGTSNPVVVGTALRRFNFVMTGLYLIAVYWLLRRAFGPIPACAGASLCALSMNVVWLSDRYYSDVPFLLAITSFLLLAGRRERVARVAAGVIAVIAFWLRTLGAALLVGWIAEAAVAREWRRFASRVLLTVLLVGSWQGYVMMVQRSPDYQQPAYPYQRAAYLLYNVSYTTNASLKVPFQPELGHVTPIDLFNRFLANLIDVPGTVGEVLSTSAMSWSETLDGIRNVPVIGLASRWRAIRAGLILLGLLALWGLWYQWRRGRVLEVVLVVTYILAVCAMNFTQETARYLNGIMPVLVLLLFTVVLGTQSRTADSRLRLVLLGLLVSTLLLAQIATLKNAYTNAFTPVMHRDWAGHDVSYRLFSYPETFRSFDAGIDWVNAHGGADDVIASSQPHWVHLRTGRRAVMPPFERDRLRQQALLDAVPVAYVLVDSIGFSATREYSLPVLQDERNWQLVHASADDTLQVYRRRREAPASIPASPEP